MQVGEFTWQHALTVIVLGAGWVLAAIKLAFDAGTKTNDLAAVMTRLAKAENELSQQIRETDKRFADINQALHDTRLYLEKGYVSNDDLNHFETTVFKQIDRMVAQLEGVARSVQEINNSIVSLAHRK